WRQFHCERNCLIWLANWKTGPSHPRQSRPLDSPFSTRGVIAANCITNNNR
ncbi:Hypothetical protein FKW44_017244, partial [Caligus rogercresseyi]